MMAVVEIIYYNKRVEKLLGYNEVHRGAYLPITVFRRKSKVAVFHSLKADEVSVIINKQTNHLEAWLFKSDDDNEGKKLKIKRTVNSPIKLRGEQELSIVFPRKNKIDEILIYLSKENETKAIDTQNDTDSSIAS